MAIGVAPENADQYDDKIERALREAAAAKAVRAIGACGLRAPLDDVQLRAFERQVALARELDLPLIVEADGAHARACELLGEWDAEPNHVAVLARGARPGELDPWAQWGACLVLDAHAANDPDAFGDLLARIPAERVLLASGAPRATIAQLAGFPARADQVVFVADAFAAHVSSEQIVQNTQHFFGK